MATTRFTLVNPEKMPSQNDYSVFIPQIKNIGPYSEQTNTKKKPKASVKSEE